MRAYARTDIHIAYSEVTKYAAIAHQIRYGQACPGTHTALQAPMPVSNGCGMLDGQGIVTASCLPYANLKHLTCAHAEYVKIFTLCYT